MTKRASSWSQPVEYKAWTHMKGRCLNPKDKDYEHYTSRGITVCTRWQESFENFYADMGDRPSPKHTLERVDNTKGYCPENCIWAPRRRQAINQGLRKDNPSGYYGVNPNPNCPNKPWRVRIGNRGRIVQVGSHGTQAEAALAYNRAARELHGGDAKQNRFPIASINYGVI